MMKKRVLIMAGGTGGHVFPALAVARELQKRDVDVYWLGTKQGMESRLVSETTIPIFYIDIGGLRGKSWRTRLMAPWQLFIALCQSIKIIMQLKPDIVLGMGGFVTGPAGLAAWLLRKPLVIHEQNAKAGMTNQLLARLASTVLEAFPCTFAARYRAVATGNPVREDILAVASPDVRFIERSHGLRLLIVGGSLGALALNELVPQALALIPEEQRPEVWHQVGRQHVDHTSQCYQQYSVANANIVPFIDDMAKAYSWADVVLCRAGALTIAELATVGIGSILIPYPYAVDDHQTRNGEYLANTGAALLKQQVELTPEWLAGTLERLQQDRKQLLNMAEAAWQLRKPDATMRVADQCLETRKK